jgi:putative flippase GtrA
MKFSISAFFANTLVRWWIVGIGFAVGSIPMLQVFEQNMQMPPWLSSILVAELTTLLRYPMNDRWVFRRPRLSWVRLWQYHVANAGSAVLWVIVYNTLGILFQMDGTFLAQWQGTAIERTIKALVATAFSVGLSMVTNFLWIWRSKASRSYQPPSTKPKSRSQLSLKNRRDYWR